MMAFERRQAMGGKSRKAAMPSKKLIGKIRCRLLVENWGSREQAERRSKVLGEVLKEYVEDRGRSP